jgi:hypothetical protein
VPVREWGRVFWLSKASLSGASSGVTWGRLSALSLNPMSPSIPRLSELLTEILEHVLLHLPDWDIIKVNYKRYGRYGELRAVGH